MSTPAGRRIKALAVAFTHAVGRSQARPLTGDERRQLFEVADEGLQALFARLDEKAAELISSDEPADEKAPKGKSKSTAKGKAKRANLKDDAPVTTEG